MDKNVRNALICLLKEEDKVSSWGISNISIDDSSINFVVDGFLYKGHVRILCDESYYKIRFDNGKTIRCLDATELPDILDFNIEKTENYQHDLENWLSSFRKN